jgi:stalled ribosome rescue protein Dom34
MPHIHAVVWIDTTEARIFRFTAEEVGKERISAHRPFRKVHHKAGAIGDGHTHLDHRFLSEVEEALRDIQEWLLVGAGVAKNELHAYLTSHAPQLAARLVDIAPMDHPTDGELLYQTYRLFQAIDRMRANSPAPGGKRWKQVAQKEG